MTATTFRVDAVAGLKSILDTYHAANPLTLVATFSARPATFAREMPFAFVEARNETVRHDAGTRTRTMTPTVVLVDRLTDNTETMGRLDPLVDALLDAYTASPHITSTGVWLGGVSITDGYEQDPDGGGLFQTVTFTFGDVSVLEGRN